MSTNQTDISFKKLLDKRITSELKEVYEEIGDETLTITSDQIWSYSVANNDPIEAVSKGVVEFKEKISFIEDTTVANQQSWYLEDGYRLTDWVSDRFGSTYTAKLFDNSGNQIFPTDSVGWLFDYKTGVLNFETTPSSFTQPFQLDGYRYIGRKGFGDNNTSPYRIVSGEVARDAIPALERTLGMVVRYHNGVRYSLGAGLTNSDWNLLSYDGYEFFQSEYPSTYVEDINIYVETTGNNSNDGRSVGSAFLTIQGAFDSIPNGYSAVIKINVGAGNFEGGTLNAVSGGGTVYLFGTTTSLETLTRVSDNGNLPGGITSQRDITAAAFSTSIIEGTHFLREDSFAPIYDDLKLLRTSSSPNLVIVSDFGQTWSTAHLVTLDTNVTSTISGSRSDSSERSLVIQFLRFDNTSGLQFPNNVSLNYLALTGANSYQITKLGSFGGIYSNSLLAITKGALHINVRGCIFDNQLQLVAQETSWGQFRGNVHGGTTTKIWIDGEGASGTEIDEIKASDFEGSGTCCLLRGKSRIRFDANIHCDGTGSLFDIGEQSLVVFNDTVGIYGTVTQPIKVNSGSLITGDVHTLRSTALNGGISNTANPGNDVQVGDSTAPIDSFSSLPIVDITTLSRAN